MDVIISNSKKVSLNSNIFHKGFEIGILIKGIDGVLEVIGGILLVFINPSRLSNLVVWKSTLRYITTERILPQIKKDGV